MSKIKSEVLKQIQQNGFMMEQVLRLRLLFLFKQFHFSGYYYLYCLRSVLGLITNEQLAHIDKRMRSSCWLRFYFRY